MSSVRAAFAFAGSLVVVISASCTGDIGTAASSRNGDVDGGTLPPVNLPVAKPGEVGVNAIMFVTQVPLETGFGGVAGVFGNHLTTMKYAARGGDLWIRYPDGALRNLTEEAGYGNAGFQGEKAIAVRQPSPHWGGTKAVFSMVVGAPTQQYKSVDVYWQLYEVTGLAQGDKAVISKIPKQPENYNNVSPFYGTDDRIIFTSDRPRSGERHLYPQLDEYEEYPTNTGLISLDTATGDLKILDHAPSGDFYPSLDSFGRVVFSRWDHLTRDQQNDHTGNTYGCFNYDSESPSSKKTTGRDEVFPEPREERTDLLAGTNLVGHAMNIFLPWQVNEDGTENETLNHIGRHELFRYFSKAIKGDPKIDDFVIDHADRVNQNSVEAVMQVRESNSEPGRYFAVDGPEFGTAASGLIMSFTLPPDRPADSISLEYVTDPETRDRDQAHGLGRYRTPTQLRDGTILASYTPAKGEETTIRDQGFDRSSYRFRVVSLKKDSNYSVADRLLTSGLTKSVEWYTPDVKQNFSGELWELDAVEIYERTRPAMRGPKIEAPEQSIFDATGVNVDTFRSWLASKKLALLVSRNVTLRDFLDRQQPYNLRISGTSTQTVTDGKVYDIKHLQFVQADQIRGISSSAGRRVLAQFLHDDAAIQANGNSGVQGAVKLATDGSMAAFVPASRAMSWQLLGPDGTPVVRERYWVSFQSGEVRVCAVCHGLSSKSQISGPVPTNPPEALRTVLAAWKVTNP